jgi:flagellar motor switch protein FliM
MPEILSQTEIDQLLSSMTKGEAAHEPEGRRRKSGKVKIYDFKSPKKITKEQIKILRGIHENFARHLSSYFSGILRAYCEINVVSIEEQPYYEYNNGLPDTVMIGVVDADPIEGSVLVDISNSVTFTLVERLLGGTGESAVPNREFTEIEISLMERIFRQIAVFMKDSWTNLINLNTSFVQIETNARLIQSMPMDEVVVIIMIDVNIGPAKGTLNLCIPCINLESVLEQLSQNKYHLNRAVDGTLEETNRQAMVSHIKASTMEGSAVFGATVLTLQEVMNLQAGDVIKFDQAVSSGVRIIIGGKPWFCGIPGVRINKKVIKISKVI